MMKLATSFVLVLAVAASGCSKKKEEGTVQKTDPNAPKVTEPAQPAAPTPLTGTALADKYKACVAMIGDAKWDDFRKDCLADSYTTHAFGGMEERKGPDALIAYFKEQKAAFPDFKLEPQLIMVSGRNLIAVELLTGTNSGPMKTPTGEVPATNKKIGLLMWHRLAIDDANKATDEWAIMDAATMLGQLGLAPKGTPVRPVMDKGIEGAPITVVTADDAKEKANLEVVKKGNQAFIDNKPADLMAGFADQVVEMDQASEKDIKGKKEIEQGFTTFRNGWTDVKVPDTQMWAAGDYVMQSMKFEGKHDKDIGKLKKTGKTVSVDIAEVMHFTDGKIDQMWRFMNGLDFARQLGLVPAPGAAPASQEPAKK